MNETPGQTNNVCTRYQKEHLLHNVTGAERAMQLYLHINNKLGKKTENRAGQNNACQNSRIYKKSIKGMSFEIIMEKYEKNMKGWCVMLLRR